MMTIGDVHATSGILSALAAPFAMTIGFILWDVHWKANGGSAFSLNMFKCTLACVGFLVMSSIFFKEQTNDDEKQSDNVFALFDDNRMDVSYLMLSSFIGIIVGDALWLESLQIIGSRRVIVMDAMKPFIGALMDWMFLGDEPIAAFGYVGMILAVIGVLAVGLEQDGSDIEEDSGEKGEDNQQYIFDNVDIEGELDDTSMSSSSKANDSRPAGYKVGYLYSIANVILDSYGFVLTKQFGGAFTSWQIGLVRFGFAGVVLVLISILMRFLELLKLNKYQIENTWYKLPTMQTTDWSKIMIGVLFVTFLCPSLTNYAIFEIPLGLALTLFSIGPLYAIPLVWILKNEVPTFRGIVGGVIAVVGVITLVLTG
mmetsp:Transcript_21417/g.27609  ORF Transcript_21417/g.27609 Transcript_21417/m.27609 type:complete len:370 (+) Transcript_21417:3266-4375(+)